MRHLLHLRIGRLFPALAGATDPDAVTGARVLGRAAGLAATLEMSARLDEIAHHACRAIEWRSASEAWCDLGDDSGGLSPWVIAEQLHAQLKSLLPIEVACGVASTRSVARAASALAAPSGLVVARPGHEESIWALALKHRLVTEADREMDAEPFAPARVPRAIARGMNVDGLAPPQLLAVLSQLTDQCRLGLDALGLLASTVRVQVVTGTGIRESMATLHDATALGEYLDDAARAAAAKVLIAPIGAGRLVVSLGQLVAGPAQGSLFGWRYDQERIRRPA